jgi:hypothetical protein
VTSDLAVAIDAASFNSTLASAPALFAIVEFYANWLVRSNHPNLSSFYVSKHCILLVHYMFVWFAINLYVCMRLRTHIIRMYGSRLHDPVGGERIQS